jgi:hypothetical protein
MFLNLFKITISYVVGLAHHNSFSSAYTVLAFKLITKSLKSRSPPP